VPSLSSGLLPASSEGDLTQINIIRIFNAVKILNLTNCNTVYPGYLGKNGIFPAVVLVWNIVPTLVTRVNHLWVAPVNSSHQQICYYRSLNIQHFDFEVVPFGTTTVPNFILVCTVVLELNYVD
jgi:hypothetical protein